MNDAFDTGGTSASDWYFTENVLQRDRASAPWRGHYASPVDSNNQIIDSE